MQKRSVRKGDLASCCQPGQCRQASGLLCQRREQDTFRRPSHSRRDSVRCWGGGDIMLQLTC